MLVLCSKILVILVLAQYVTSVEFYKSKRVPPKYKEIRRTYSLKSKEENVDSTPADTFLEKNIDQDTSFGNIETTDDKQPILTTISTNENGGTIDYSLKNNEEKDKTEPVEADVNDNSDQAKESIDNVQSTENKQLSFTTTVKPKRRPFNLRKISTPSEIDIESNDRDKVSIEKIQTTNKKQFSLTTSTITAKRRNFNLRPIRNKSENAQNKPVETFVKDNIDRDEETIDDKQITEEMKPDVTTTTIKPKRRFSNLRTLKNRVEKVQSIPANTSDIVNTDQDKISNGNLQTIREETSLVTTRKIKPLRRTLNVYSLKRKEEKTDSKLISSGNVQTTEDEKVIITTGTIVDEDTYQDKVSNGDIQVIGDKKPNVIESTVKPESPTSTPYLLKMKEGNTNGETLEALIKEYSLPEQDNVAIDNIQIIKDKKPIMNTTTIKPKIPTLSPQLLKNKEKYTDSTETIVNENNGQIKVSLGTLKITGDNKLSHSLNEDTNSASVETIFNEKTVQNKEFIGNVQVTGEKKVTLITSAIKPRTRTLNLYSLKRKEENSENKPVSTPVNEKTDQDQVTRSNLRAIGNQKLSVTSRIMKPQRRTSNLNSLKKKEENTSSEPIETLFNENIRQGEASTGDVQNSGDKKFSLTSSLKRKEENSERKPFSTQKIDRDQVTTINERTTEDKKLRVTTSTVKPKTSTSSLHSQEKETDSKSVETIVKENTGQIKVSLGNVTGDNKLSLSLNKNTKVASFETIVNEKTGQNKVSIGNVQATRENKVTVTTSTIKPRTRTLNLYSLKRKEENSENKLVATPEKTDQAQVTRSNVRATGNQKLSVTSRIIKPQRRTSNLNSLKKKEENTSSKPIETLVNENQEKASTGDVQNTGDKMFSLISSTIKPKRLTLNLDSLKTNEDNPKSKSVDMFVSKNFDHEIVSIDNLQSEQATVNHQANSHISTEEPEILTLNSAISEHGSKRIIKTQRKIVVQNIGLDAESKPSTVSSVSNKDRYMKVLAAQAPQSYENYYQTTTPYTQLEKTTQKHDNFVPIVGVENYVYAYNGDYHYSYEGGDGTKAFERGELKSSDGSSNASGVVGGYSYKDKDGNDFNLSYTAGEGGYQPVGAHLPTSPPIPPAIQRVLRILATKTTPEPITESTKSDH